MHNIVFLLNTKMYNTALSLYFIPPFEQFTTFFSEYQQDFSLVLTL